jgi:acyl carrier protein
VTVRYTAVDVADRAAMTDMLLAYRRSGAPAIRGVFHAAGVVDYDSVSDLEPDRLAAVLAPKLAGGWNLHRAFDDGSVDYFVLFSSASALLSSPLLAGYAAGNAFLDALAHHRRARNLAATTVNWGFWDSVGMVVRHERDTGRTVLPQGMSRFSPEDAFTVLEHVLTRDLAQVAVLPADWAAWARAYPAAATAPLLREILQDEGRFSPGVPRAQATRPAVEDEAPVTAAPSTVTSPARDDEVERYLVAEVSRVLGIQPERINPKRPLNRSGMDSLMATELRTHLERTFKVKLPMVKLLNGASIADLTALIAGTGESPAEEPVPPTVAGPDGEPDGEVEQYVVAEVSRILGVQPERINPKRPLSRSGMDSLMATELRTHLERKYKVKLPMVKLLNTATVADLVSLISGSGAGGRNGGAA